jgi:hypothetical protein
MSDVYSDTANWSPASAPSMSNSWRTRVAGAISGDSSAMEDAASLTAGDGVDAASGMVAASMSGHVIGSSAAPILRIQKPPLTERS